MSDENYQFPPYGDRFNENIEEISLLMTLNSNEIRSEHGGPHKVEILNKSAIVLATTCWEANIEDLAKTAFQFMLDNASGPNLFPAKLLALVSSDMFGINKSKKTDERKIWSLAGEGWRNILRQYCELRIKSLHTPSAKIIDSLFKDLLGLNNLSKCWKWRGVTNRLAIEKLDNLISTRGDIAHKLSTNNYIKKGDVLKAIKLVSNLAVNSSNAVREHLIEITGKEPWGEVIFNYEP